ncbi:MAG: DUF1538 domain-containing protein, partial [Clostridia bacterium]|nr:DUF1538 domain-containing protein [Clostridia bacterium]
MSVARACTKSHLRNKMKIKFFQTVKETFISSLPLAVIIIICLCIAPLDTFSDYLKIIVGYFCVVFGQSMFLSGLEASILPIGRMVGGSFAKYNKLVFVLSFGFIFGLLATVAEPALSVLAKQINGIMPLVNSTLFIWITATGIGIGVAIALLRIVKNINIKLVFAVLYALTFILVIFAPSEFVSLAFDGSGATTGDISVPFILALGLGISATASKSKTNDDSLGIIGIASGGPIIAVLLYGVIVKAVKGGLPAEQPFDMSAASGIGDILLRNLGDVALAVLPIILISIPFLLLLIKLPKKTFAKLMLGVIPVYLGLLVFLSGIDFGFGFIGQYIGQMFFEASKPEWFKWILLGVGFILGAAITVSEPAVTVLGVQIEELTNGHIKKLTIRVTLAIGIGVASLLSILKILTGINILYFLVPLYAISLLMMVWTPKLFVGLAFDSGGVTGGALTSAFLTPLTLSIAQASAIANGTEMSILTNGFGIISFISVTPLIAIQVLGIVYNVRLKRAEREEQIDSYEELEAFVMELNNDAVVEDAGYGDEDVEEIADTPIEAPEADEEQVKDEDAVPMVVEV